MYSEKKQVLEVLVVFHLYSFIYIYIYIYMGNLVISILKRVNFCAKNRLKRLKVQSAT